MPSLVDPDDEELILRIREASRRSDASPDVASAEVCDSSERLLKTTLHPFHRRLLLEVANGGFGPGYGLFGLPPTAGDPPMIELREMLKAVCDERLRAEMADEYPDEISGLPRLSVECWRGLLPICDWGCGSWCFIDSGSERGAIVLSDEGGGLRATPYDIRTFFDAWAKGIDVEGTFYGGPDQVMINPFTGQPTTIKGRGAPLGQMYVELPRR